MTDWKVCKKCNYYFDINSGEISVMKKPRMNGKNEDDYNYYCSYCRTKEK